VKFDVITIFPAFFTSILDHGVFKRARAGGKLEVSVHDLRNYADDRHRTVDDRPFGGGAGMVLKPEPLFKAVEALRAGGENGPHPVVLLSPQGRLFNQTAAAKLAREPRAALICGRYEGVDERVATGLATDEFSIGDYVLAGGELAAAVIMEAVARLLPGVLGNEESALQESFSPWPNAAPGMHQKGAMALQSHGAASGGVLDFPHYTRPPEFRGWRVPEVLLSGDHEAIRRWRRRQALAKTVRRRPDLLAQALLSGGDLEMLEDMKREEAVVLRDD
jgi:tRNA (guanine37-N1)-methyltransferase